MHRGQNPDSHRPALTHSPYGPPPGTPAAFPGPFGGRNFPPHFPKPGVFPSPAPAHLQGGASATGPGFTEPLYQSAPPNQFQQGWTFRETDLESLEVKKKAEEFLRFLEAKDRLDISDALEKVLRRQSAEDEADRRSSRARSRSRNRSRSRGKSRGRSRARSRSRAKSRARSRSRGKSRSRAKSRARSRSRSRGKSRSRAKSRARSRSPSRGRSAARSKSQCRLEPHRGTKESSNPSVSLVPDLFQNLKQVLQRTDLEKHLDLVQNACTTKQQSPTETSMSPEDLQKLLDLESPADLGLNSVLPHERAGGPDEALPRILLWDDPGQNKQTLLNKRELSSVEDEERFLYGDEEGKKKPQAVTVPLAQTRPVEPPASSPQLAKAPPPPQTRQPEVTPEEYEKVKNMLKTIGLNLSMADICKMATRLKQKREGQRGASATQSLRNTPETLDCAKVQKSEDARSIRSGSSHSHRDPETREKVEGKDGREKQIQEKRKEYLVKELEGLLKYEGTGDLIPVIGFFCKRCEEFFGDLSSAKEHKHKQSAADQQHDDDQRSRDFKPVERKEADERGVERKRARDKESLPRTRDQKEDESGSEKSARKKKKKKEKKTKKKEKKKKKYKVKNVSD